MARKKPVIDPATGLLNYGWVRDPNVKCSNDGGAGNKAIKGGGPPAGHVRRCQGTNKYSEQCGKWARVDRDFCKKHGGREGRSFRRSTMWYARIQTEGLRKRLQSMAEVSPEERLALNAEIDLARELADHAIELFEKCHYGPNAESVKKDKPHLRVAARDSLQSALDHVASLVTKATKVHVMSNAVLEMQHVEFVAAQFTKIIEDLVLPLDAPTADACLARLANIKVPKKGDNVAEQLREAVKEMDDTLNC